MGVTLHDICRETGLSTATVSRVLNNSPLVKEATRLRVQKAMDKLDYHPLPAARALAGQRNDAIGVLSPYVGSGFFTELLRGIDQIASENKLHVITAFGHGAGDEQDLLLRLIRERRVDALVVLNLDLPAEFMASCKNDRVPIVSVDTPVVEHGIASVSIDNRRGGRDIMGHLLEHGHRDIVILTGPVESYDSRERLAGCREAMAEAGLTLNDRDAITGEFTMESGGRLMREILANRDSLPDAVLCLNDAMALGALGVLREAGIGVPEGIAITGFDDSEAAPLMGLTSVNVPLYEMGRQAARLAIEAQTEDVSQRHVVISSSLVVRESCGCPR